MSSSTTKILAFLQNSVWPPSAILDLLEEIVGPPRRPIHGGYVNILLWSAADDVISVWIFVINAWKSFSWNQNFSFFCGFDSKNLGEHRSHPKKAHPCSECCVLSRLRSRSDAPCSSVVHMGAFPQAKIWATLGVPSFPIRRRRKTALANGQKDPCGPSTTT